MKNTLLENIKTCINCSHYKYKPINRVGINGCYIWTNYLLGIKPLPISTYTCNSCGNKSYVDYNVVLLELNNTGPKVFIKDQILIGNTAKEGILPLPHSSCMFFKGI